MHKPTILLDLRLRSWPLPYVKTAFYFNIVIQRHDFCDTTELPFDLATAWVYPFPNATDMWTLKHQVTPSNIPA